MPIYDHQLAGAPPVPSLWNQVHSATNCILNTLSTREQIVTAVATLYQQFSTLTNIYGNAVHVSYDKNTFLENGIAVAPLVAAKCLQEPFRTAQFLRGIHAAIQSAQERFPHEPIRILYAGCGPYATLLLPLTTQFTAEEIQVTLLDIHETSLTAVQKLINNLGANQHIPHTIQADATTYKPEHSAPYHILVIEMLQGALHDEMQVATTLNLHPYLHPQGILIPEEVNISACLTDAQIEDFGTLTRHDEDGYPVDNSQRISQRIPLGQLMTLNADSLPAMRQHLIQQEDIAASATITLPNQLPVTKEQFMLLTSVTVFDQIVIQDYQSHVCHPVILYNLKKLASGMQIHFSYHLGQRPQFRYHTSHTAVSC